MADRVVPPYAAPDGQEWFVGSDPYTEWRVPSQYTVCRARRCGRTPVADLRRSLFTRKSGSHDAWWAYCERHLYGGWVEGGKIVRWLLREAGSTG